MAAVLACGAGAVVSFRDAAGLWGLLAVRSGFPHITVPGRRAPERPRILTHETAALSSADVGIRHGIPVTSVARTLADIAVAEPDRLARACGEAFRNNLVTREALVAQYERIRGQAGARALREIILRRGPAPTRSDLEDMFVAFVDEVGIERPLINSVVEGFEVDAYWPHADLVVELDSLEHHRTREAMDEDARRNAALTAAGKRMLRLTWTQLTVERARLGSQLAAALSAARDWRAPARSRGG